MKSKQMETCSICVEPYNKSQHQEIKCHYCEYKTCLKCAKTYLLESLNYIHIETYGVDKIFVSNEL